MYKKKSQFQARYCADLFLLKRQKQYFFSTYFTANNWECNKLSLMIVLSIVIYSWRLSRFSAPNHWLVHGHMTSNNETVSRQMPWAGNIAKIVTSNGKQFSVTREMLTAVARHLPITWLFFHWFDPFALLCNKSLNDWSLGEQWILFSSNLNVALDFVSGNIEILGKQNSRFPSGPVINCLMLYAAYTYFSSGAQGFGWQGSMEAQFPFFNLDQVSPIHLLTKTRLIWNLVCVK